MSDREMESSVALSADDAFSLLGNETRVQILQSLGEADGPLSFTELRNRVGVRPGGQFNYHLKKVVGHFVDKTDEGYHLRQTGRRVVEAVLSGAVTEEPVIERVRIDETCQHCGAPIEMNFRQGRVKTFCTECDGMWGTETMENSGYLGSRSLPPAGVHERTPHEMYQTAWTWTQFDILALASDTCPRCSATLDVKANVCESHDAADGLCCRCDGRYALKVHFRCTNCIFEWNGTGPVCVAANTDLLEFLTTRGLNPIAPKSISAVQRVYSDFNEEILSMDPLKARFTFTVDDDALSLTVDDNLSVIDVARHRSPELD